MLERWKTLAKEVLGETPIFRLLQVRREAPDGPTGDFWVMELPEWINVVALTPDGDLVLVRQYRHGNDEVTLEIPGGNVDPGESPGEAAARELLEETGYEAEQWHKIGSVEPNPAFMDNVCHIFLATGARRVAEPDTDEYEEIEVVLEPREAFDELIAAGHITHSLVVTAAYFLERWEA